MADLICPNIKWINPYKNVHSIPHNNSHFLLLQVYFLAVANWFLLISYICKPCVYFISPAEERDAVQKKPFTKWVNSHLARVSCRIADLYNDLRDGYMLTRLLEVLSGEMLVGQPILWFTTSGYLSVSRC